MPEESLSVVYVLTNSAMPGLVKIGKTFQDDHTTRVSQLYTTGVPVPFDIEYACKVKNADKVESALHIAFAPQRINPRREFFRMDPEQAVAILRLLNVDDVTEQVKAESDGIDEQDKHAAKQLRSRRPNLNFDEMSIPPGSVLYSVNSEETATVVSAKKVKFREREPISLSEATRELLGIEYSVAPAPYWLHESKLLKEIYDDTYSDC